MKIHTVQLNLGDLIEGTQGMDNGEYGAYVALFLCLYNKPDQIVEINDVRLAKIANCTAKEWRRVRDIVLSKFVNSDQKITHNRVKKDVKKYQIRSEINRNNALGNNNSSKRMASECPSETDGIQYPSPNTQYKKDQIRVNVTTDNNTIINNYDFDILKILSPDGLMDAKAFSSSAGHTTESLAEVYNNAVKTGIMERPRIPDKAYIAWIKRIITNGKSP